MQSEDTPNMVCQEKITGMLRAVCGKPAEFSVSCGETEVCVEEAARRERRKSSDEQGASGEADEE